jgi:hypothetical protein
LHCVLDRLQQRGGAGGGSRGCGAAAPTAHRLARDGVIVVSIEVRSTGVEDFEQLCTFC